jgi:hypothetical protein
VTNASGSSPNKAFLSTPYKVRGFEEAAPVALVANGLSNIVIRELGVYVEIWERVVSGGVTLEFRSAAYYPTPNYTPESIKPLLWAILAQGSSGSQYTINTAVTDSPEPTPDGNGLIIFSPPVSTVDTSGPNNSPGNLSAQAPGIIPDLPGGNVSRSPKPTTVGNFFTNIGWWPAGTTFQTAYIAAGNNIAATGPASIVISYTDGAILKGRRVIYAEAT